MAAMSCTYSITTFSLSCPKTMIQPLHKHSPSKTLIFLVTCVGFFGAVLIADYFWASSSSSLSLVYSSLASNSARDGSTIVVFPADGAVKNVNVTKKNQRANKFLSPTFADIPAPELKWEAMAPAPVPRLDGSSIQIKDLLYVISGYGSLDHVHSHVDVYNFTSNTWGGRLLTPKEMAHSHLGVASDGRFIYVISGQYGPQCSGPVSHSFVLDTVTKKWKKMPPLPVPRYAPATQIWRGRLHVMGGSKGNRHTAGVEHWSIAVRDGKALEKEWRTEVPIPRGGPHRACIVVDDRLYVIGGQEGDFMAKPGSPIFKCSRRKEVIYGDVYMLDGGMKWTSLPPMPKPNSHIEFSWIVLNNSIVITGGTSENHPVNKRMTLVGEVFRFELDTMKWSVIGRLPYRVKTALAAFWDGWLYFTSGQRDRGPDNPQPKQVVGDMWRTRLHL